MPAHIPRKASAKRAERTRIGIDHARRHLATRIQTKFCRRFRRQRTDAFPRHHRGVGKPGPFLQITKPGQFEIIRLPAGIFLRQKIPLRRLRAI